jgi:hypothetical protein
VKQKRYVWLVSEDGRTYSLGRVSFWTIFIISLGYWLIPLVSFAINPRGEPVVVDFPDSLLQFLLMAFAYNLSKKAIDAYKVKCGGAPKGPPEEGEKC